MNSAEILVLLRLHAELARIHAEVSLLRESHGALLRVAGIFYDAGCSDTAAPDRGRRRHLRSLDD